MSITNVTENAILNLCFSATAWANVADNAAGTPITNIHVALQTADPGEAGTMQTSEAAYTNYARVNVPRSAAGWTTSSAGSVSPQANIDFPSSGAAGTTISHFSVGKTGGGAADAFWNGTVAPPIAVGAAGITPRLTTATAVTLD
jgi:hypothetical protein